VLKEGTDIAVFATGYMTGLALQAAEAVEGKISVRVINVGTIKPLKEEVVIDLVKDVKAVVTAEEHSIVGGLGSAIAEVLRREGKPIEFVGINDVFGCSAHNYLDVLKFHRLTKEHIVEAITSQYAL
jgi:transketolase